MFFYESTVWDDHQTKEIRLRTTSGVIFAIVDLFWSGEQWVVEHMEFAE